MPQNLEEKCRELEAKISVLEKENELLTVRAEEILLLGLVAESIGNLEAGRDVLENVLERVSILKDIPYCACCRLAEDSAQMICAYATFREDASPGDRIALSSSVIQTLDQAAYFICHGECEEKGLSIILREVDFVPYTVAVLPFASRSIPKGIFVFADDDRTEDRLSPMVALLQRIVEMTAAKLDNLSLVHELRRLTADLDQKVETRTAELMQANEKLRQEIAERREAETALQESEARYRNLFEASQDGVFVINLRGEYQDANPAATALVGYSLKELRQMTVDDLLMPGEDLSPQERQRAWREGRTVEVVLRHKDGHAVPVELNISPVREDGKPQLVMGVARDITERVRAEESLRQYAERLRILREIDQAILEARSPEAIAQAALYHIRRLVPCLGGGVVMFDFEAREAVLIVADVSDGLTAPAGMRLPLGAFRGVEEAVEVLRRGEIHVMENIPALSQMPPEVKTLQMEGLRAVINVPLIFQGELIGLLSLGTGGSESFSEEQIEIARELADQLAIAIQQARLHEEVQRHAEKLEERVAERTRQLAESEARYRQIVESPLVGIWQADAEGRFVFINQRLAEMSGYSQEEVIDMTMLMPITPKLRPWLAERMQKRRAGELSSEVVEVEMVRKDGSRFTALVAPASLYDSSGNFAGFIGAMIDITERKRLQQALARRVEEQRRLVNLMAGREVRMAELKEAIRQLRTQLEAAGLTPVADDPLLAGREDIESEA